LNFSQDTVLENMFNMRTDTVIPRYSFAKKFTLIVVNGKNKIFSLSKGPV
jgi:hypothetical protein